MNDLIEQQNKIFDDNSNLLLTKNEIKNIEKNFGGLPNIIDKIKTIFLNEFSQLKLDDFANYNPIK